MPKQSTRARRQLERFVSALFLPDELIELRFIESWTSDGKKRSRVVRPSEWTHPDELVSRHSQLTSFARESQANIYFGVCPRPRRGDSHDETIKTVRCVWCDMDGVTAEQAEQRWHDAGVPRPSLVVKSGSGIHGYWLLQRDLQTPAERSQFLMMLPYFYKSFGGDHVQNLSRVLRPPGTMNFKDARNGRRPLPCTLLACDSKLRYPLQAFSAWIDLAENDSHARESNRSFGSADASSREANLDAHAEVIALVSRLDQPSSDRSRRDFAIVCDLLRLGLSRDQIWPLVAGSSKFESNGRPYFDHTIANAERSVSPDETTHGRPRTIT